MSEATITNPGAGAPNPTTPASDTSGHGLFAADRKWVTPVLVVALVVIFVGSLIIGGIRTAGQDETFVGTDSAATEAAEEAGAKPWFQPLFEPAGEVESGLFAIQAAIGSGIIFYCLGRMSGKKAARKQEAAIGVTAAAADASTSSAAAISPDGSTPGPTAPGSRNA